MKCCGVFFNNQWGLYIFYQPFLFLSNLKGLDLVNAWGTIVPKGLAIIFFRKLQQGNWCFHFVLKWTILWLLEYKNHAYLPGIWIQIWLHTPKWLFSFRSPNLLTNKVAKLVTTAHLKKQKTDPLWSAAYCSASILYVFSVDLGITAHQITAQSLLQLDI